MDRWPQPLPPCSSPRAAKTKRAGCQEHSAEPGGAQESRAVSKEILRVKLPKPVETTLANGLTVLILEDHRLPTVTVQLQISGAGAIFEPADRPGLASVTAQMMMQGTASRGSRQIAEESERMGANVSASAPFGSSATAFQASGLSDNFEQWFALATDVFAAPQLSAG